MNRVIERGPYGAQLCLTGPAECVEVSYQMDLMMSERPEFLLPVYRLMTTQGPRYTYPITGLTSLSDLAANKRLNSRQVRKMIHRLKADLQMLPDHLLSTEQVPLHPDMVFLSQSGVRLRLIYQPFLPVTFFYDEQQLISWFGEELYHNRFLRRRWEKKFALEAGKKPAAPPQIDANGDASIGTGANEHTAAGHRHILSVGLAFIQVAALVFTTLSIVFQDRFALILPSIRIPLLVIFLLAIPIHFTLMLQEDKLTVKKWIETSGWLHPLALIRRGRDTLAQKAKQSDANLGRIREMPTELLSSRQGTFRLATLSEGMIGTAAETAGQRAFILTEEFVIGRDFRLVDLCLSGYAVGRRHAQITRKGATFFLTDFGSKNGTHLNGERLNKLVEYRLPDHCQLQFADRLFYFEAEEMINQS